MKIVNESHRKPNELWVDQGSEYYNKVMKIRSQDENISI